MTEPLDRPVWTALNTGWAHLAVGGARARRLHPDYGPFAASADAEPASLAALAALADAPPGAFALATIDIEASPPPPGLHDLRREPTVQMVWAGGPAPDADGAVFLPLGDADGAEMLALAELTRPGPFARRTHRLSQFLGVRDEGRLVAMAGERMRLPGFSELSGVCTHPDARGRGLAAALSRAVTARILARGETPFLHAWASNTGAIRIYEALGYRVRTELTGVLLARD